MQVFGSNAPVVFALDDHQGNTTQYLAIDEEGEWPAEKPLKSRLVTKGDGRFLIVEYPESEIHWLEPKF